MLKMLLRLAISLVVIAFFSGVTIAAETASVVKKDEIKHLHPCISGGAKKSVLYLGVEGKDKVPEFHGTGFLVSYKNYIYIVTAKHVVTGLYEKYKDEDITFFHNTKNGQGQVIKMDWIVRRTNSKWIYSEKYDVAVMPYVLMDQIDFRIIPEDFFITSDKLMELQDVFYISYQPGIDSPGKITPIVRSGAVSIINDDGTFILDAFVFPGNSGSPVFVKPDAIQDEVSKNQNCKFIGIVGAYLPYSDVAISAQTRQPRIIFEENTGLAIIWPVQALNDIFQSDNFNKQFKTYKEQYCKFVKDCP